MFAAKMGLSVLPSNTENVVIVPFLWAFGRVLPLTSFSTEQGFEKPLGYGPEYLECVPEQPDGNVYTPFDYRPEHLPKCCSFRLRIFRIVVQLWKIVGEIFLQDA